LVGIFVYIGLLYPGNPLPASHWLVIRTGLMLKNRNLDTDLCCSQRWIDFKAGSIAVFRSICQTVILKVACNYLKILDAKNWKVPIFFLILYPIRPRLPRFARIINLTTSWVAIRNECQVFWMMKNLGILRNNQFRAKHPHHHIWYSQINRKFMEFYHFRDF
jgi:hypothetical protein